MIFDAVTSDPITIVQTGGVVGLLLVILIGGAKPSPWWVFGWRYREVLMEREEYKQLALKSTNLAESLAEVQKGKGG